MSPPACYKCGSFDHQATNRNCPRPRKATIFIQPILPTPNETPETRFALLVGKSTSIYQRKVQDLKDARSGEPTKYWFYEGPNDKRKQLEVQNGHSQSVQGTEEPNELQSDTYDSLFEEDDGSKELSTSTMQDDLADEPHKGEALQIIHRFIHTIKKSNQYERRQTPSRPWSNHPSTASGSRATNSSASTSHFNQPFKKPGSRNNEKLPERSAQNYRRHPYANAGQKHIVDRSAVINLTTDNTPTYESIGHGEHGAVSTPRFRPFILDFPTHQASECAVYGSDDEEDGDEDEGEDESEAEAEDEDEDEDENDEDEDADVDIEVDDNNDNNHAVSATAIEDYACSSDSEYSSDDEPWPPPQPQRIVYAHPPPRPHFRNLQEQYEWIDRPENDPLQNLHWFAPFNYVGSRNQVTESHRVTYGRSHQGWRECRSMGNGLGHPFPF
jgi:hypothetical protein